MSKRIVAVLTALLVIGLVFAGCAAPAATPAPTSPPAPQATQPAAAPATPAPAAAKFECKDKLGCVDDGPNDPIHIAYAFVVSGENSTLGLDTKYGAELAVDDAGGKVLGHAIKFDG